MKNPHVPASMPEPDLLAEGTLLSGWINRLEEDRGRNVLHDPSRGWITAGALRDSIERVATALRAEGLTPGDRILVGAASCIGLVETYAGALRLGLVAVPFNAAYREREVAHIVGDAEPSAALVDDAERASWITAASAHEVRIVHPGFGTDSRATADIALPGPLDPALMCYTSGTTGAPKGAVLTHANILAGVESVRIAWRWTESDRLLLALPLFHVHGLGVGLHGTLLAGASAVLVGKFEPDAVLSAISKHDATLFFGVPAMYALLESSPLVGELAKLRLCVSGSAPLPPALFDRIESVTGQRMLERYGMTETLMLVSNPYEGERRPGTVGFPLPGVELRMQDGPSGEIFVRGPNVFSGYWRQPEVTAECLDRDGWFRTGDIGELDDVGYLRIAGRSKELIISGGYNVYPREVEDVLRGHPAVADVAVAGIPDEKWGEIVAAFVVARSRLPERDLIDFADGMLAPYKRPRIIRFVDEIPRNALGKVLRDRLPV
jgi:malonyl-CoA/methylmalonyl-CoA synthetase